MVPKGKAIITEGVMVKDKEAAESEKRFAAYVDQLGGVIGHADRKRPLVILG